jgi:hypothetical protein
LTAFNSNGSSSAVYANVKTKSIEGTGNGNSNNGVSTVLTGINLSVNPSELDFDLIVGANVSKVLSIKNIGNISGNLSLEINNLVESSLSGTNMYLNPGETKVVNLIVSISKEGIYYGRVLIKSRNEIIKIIPVSVSVSSQNSLVKVIVSLTKENKILKPGNDLSASIKLTKTSVSGETLNGNLLFQIKDSEGKIYYEENQVVSLSESSMSFDKVFPTGDLQDGRYVLGVTFTYNDKTAVGSAQFTVGAYKTFNMLVLIFRVLILVVIIIIIIILLRRRKRFRPLPKNKVVLPNVKIVSSNNIQKPAGSGAPKPSYSSSKRPNTSANNPSLKRLVR